MPEYVNPNNHTVHLIGPDGNTIHMRSRQKMILSEFFDKYRIRGFIRLANNTEPAIHAQKDIISKIQLKPANNRTFINRQQPRQEHIDVDRRRKNEIARAQKISNNNRSFKPIVERKIVGKAIASANADEILHGNLNSNNYPISNNIGVGILSYNRYASLKRLVDSIIKFTDMTRTTIFISDDCSDDKNTIEYLLGLSQNKNFVIITNDKRLGVAGNSNRLLRCLSRFKYGILLNDDVEILDYGWDYFYKNAFENTKMHHFIYRQNGVYGANNYSNDIIDGVNLRVVNEKPHGAVLAFTNEMINKCGYFNEEYGIYGMEHIDWSSKAFEFDLQKPGFHDVEGSENYFIIHDEKSVVANKQAHLKNAKKMFKSRVAEKCQPSELSLVPKVSYIIPFRNLNRTDAIHTVVNNIRAQKFPDIQIILSEHDSSSSFKQHLESNCIPVEHSFALEPNNHLFNKSIAFNKAAMLVNSEIVVLHDADILAVGDYTTAVYTILSKHTACHIGKSVVYADQISSNEVCLTGIVNDSVKCDRVVGYFEGGSLACRISEYWKCGGFNEDFWGYGCEDCDFYARLRAVSTWCEDRAFDFLHLWHSRADGWNLHHDTNRRIESSLKAKTITERIKIQLAQLQRLGYMR